MGLGGREGSAWTELGLFRNSRNEVGDSEPARTVNPDAAFHPIGVAGVADEDVTSRAHVIGAARHKCRDLLCRLAVAAIEALVGDAVISIEAPNLGQEGLDGRRRENPRHRACRR